MLKATYVDDIARSTSYLLIGTLKNNFRCNVAFFVIVKVL